MNIIKQLKIETMKNLTFALIIATALAACGGKQNTENVPVVVVDTAAIQRNAVAAEQARMKVEETRIKAEKDSLKIVAQKEADRVASGPGRAKRRNPGAAGYPFQ